MNREEALTMAIGCVMMSHLEEPYKSNLIRILNDILLEEK